MLFCISYKAFDIDAPFLKNESLPNYQCYPYDAKLPNQAGHVEVQVYNTNW